MQMWQHNIFKKIKCQRLMVGTVFAAVSIILRTSYNPCHVGINLKPEFIEKTKEFHFSASIFKYVAYHDFLFFMCCGDSNGLRDAIFPKSPELRKYFLTVSTETLLSILHDAATS